MKSAQYASKPLTNVTAVGQALKEIAFSQIAEMASRMVYSESQFANTCLTKKEMQDKTFSEFANLIFEKIKGVKEQFALLDEISWKTQFIAACEARKQKLEAEWETSWATECDGKKLLREFHELVGVKESMLKFKLRVVSTMASSSSENWLAMESLLSGLMVGTPK